MTLPNAFPCLPSAHHGDPTPVGPPQRRRPLRHPHHPVRGDHGVGARHAAQLGQPQLIRPLGQVGATRSWADFSHALFIDFQFLKSFFLLKFLKIHLSF
jgi:hypothetical protein